MSLSGYLLYRRKDNSTVISTDATMMIFKEKISTGNARHDKIDLSEIHTSFQAKLKECISKVQWSAAKEIFLKLNKIIDSYILKG